MIAWSFSTKKDKNPGWYTAAFMACLVLIIWWIYTWVYFLPIVILILIWVYFLVENNSPESMNIEIDDDGILIGEEFYDYPKIESFSIKYTKKRPCFLRIRLKTWWFKILDVPLAWVEQNSAEIRATLLQFVAEDEKWEMSSSDSLISYLKL